MKKSTIFELLRAISAQLLGFFDEIFSSQQPFGLKILKR